MARINNSRKALFQTPGSITEEQTFVFSNNVNSTSSSSSTASSSMNSKNDIIEKALAKSIVNLENEFQQAKKDTHKERLTKLKTLLNEIDEDNWKYENVDKLIGI